jgi:type IV fimbrial biogenesis protein FimT
MRQTGFTLLELLFVLLFAAILLTLGVPALQRIVLDSRRTTDVNAFVSSVQLARSESAKRGLAVQLCKTTDGISCADRAGHFDTGWLVFVEDPDSTLLMHYEPVMDGSIRSNRAAYTFRPNFRRGTNGTVTFCDQRGGASARTVIISYTGRPRVATTTAGGAPIDCTG